MSDGLRRVAGAGSHIALAGRTYRTSPLTLGMRAEIESHLVARRPNLLVKVAQQIDGLPDRHHDRLWDAAIRQMERHPVASEAEVSEFLHTFEGACYLLWLLIREHHPEVDGPAAAVRLAGEIPLWELQARLDSAAGAGDLKNCAGPAAPAGPPPQPAQNCPVQTPCTTAEYPGPACTVSLPANTSGSQSE